MANESRHGILFMIATVVTLALLGLLAYRFGAS